MRLRWRILFGLGVAVMIFAAFALYRTKAVYRDTQERYNDICETFVTVAGPEAVSLSPPETESVADKEGQRKEISWANLIDVDLNGLLGLYPDVVGWLYFEDGEISYPILYSGDNEMYLHRDYTGEKSSAGTIFLDGASTADFNDPHTIVYGHNMRDGSMFGKLRQYQVCGEDERAQYFQIRTVDRVLRYQMILGAEVPVTHALYQTYGRAPAKREDFLLYLRKSDFMAAEGIRYII